MGFFNSFIRSWQFLIQCVRFFKHNKDLLFFPVISLMLSTLLLFILFAGGLLDIKQVSSLFDHHFGLATLIFLGLYFLFSFLIVYFNASLIACATLRLQGNPASVGDGLELAAKRWWVLLQWTILNTTIGFLIRILERSHNIIEDIIVAVLGVAWAMSTYFIIPIMVFENVDPFTAITRGFSIFGRGWRRVLSIFMIFNLAAIAIFAVLFGLQHLMPNQTTLFLEIGIGLIVILSLLSATLGSAFNGIVNSALYLTYAQNQEPLGFDSNLLQQAFVKK